MSRLNDLPFPRGSTFWGGATVADSTSGAQLEGKEYLVEDNELYNNTGSYVKLRIVRNIAAFTLAPKRLLRTVAGKTGQSDGYANSNPQTVLGVVDQAYTGNIAINDLFYCVVEGPCLVKTPLAGDVTNSIAVGDWLVNATGATSGATTGGRAADISLAGATAVLGNQILYAFGQAMSAATTANTDADLLTFVDGGMW